jgi:immunoglobulin-binding protein 1
MEEQPKSIRALFLSAESARQALSRVSSPTNSPTYQDSLTNTIATYEQCLQLSQQVSLFSPNETLDDVSSTDLQ